jgi:hypothetical protein
MSESIDLTKYNIMTDSMYDTTGTQMSEPKRNMIYTTPFEQQPKYLMRAGNKPFQPSKYPSSGPEWYDKRAVNDVDLQTAMDSVLPDQQVQNWSRVKTVILQKDDAKKESQENMTSNEEIRKAYNRIKKRQHEKKKEGYITSPYAEVEDTWSSAGRINDFSEEKFTVAGKELQLIDIIIVVLAIIIIIVAVYIYLNKCKQPKTAPTTENYPIIDKNNDNVDDNNDIIDNNPSAQPPVDDNIEPDTQTETHNEGGSKVLNCGSLCGGAAFDTKI